MKKLLVFSVLLLWLCSTKAQGFGNMKFTVIGGVQDATGLPVTNAVVEALVLSLDSGERFTQELLASRFSDESNIIFKVFSDSTGLFEADLDRSIMQKLRTKGLSLRNANVALSISATGYENTVNVVKPEMQRSEAGVNIMLGITTLMKSEERIKTVEIKTKAVEMKGDTAEMNANNYKVNPDASAEDLVKKLPGVTQRNGEIEAQGEKVARVLVDGKPYFGEDPKAALKNVPADAISKIQIYDARSEQSQFTGFDDGNTTKTMNIITKTGFKNGQFGKFYGGLGRSIEGTGEDNKYKSGANYNKFDGDQRFSILFQTNNINEQNFAFDDISSSFGGGNFGRRGMGDFFVSGNEGITKSTLFGLNYSNKWSKKVDFTASYFFSDAINDNSNTTNRIFVTGGRAESGLRYQEMAEQTNLSQQHRLSSRIEWNVDSNDRLIFQPRLTWQAKKQSAPTLGNSYIGEFNQILNVMDNVFNDQLSSSNLAFELDWLHAFDKRGRSLAIELIPSRNTSLGTAVLDNRFFSLNDTSIRQQETSIDQGVLGLAAEIEYTEPLDSTYSLLFSYEMNLNQNNSSRLNRVPSYINGTYDNLDTLLSSQFDNGYSRHAIGTRLQRMKKGVSMTLGVDAQLARLDGTQTFPNPLEINRNFFSILPQLTISSGKRGANGIRLFYRTSNNAPSVTQLQDVINNSNPLQLTTGNPNLVQDYQHRLFTRYFNMDSKSGRMFFAFIRGSASMNALTTSTQIVSANSSGVKVQTGDSVFVLRSGSQLSKPVNLDGAFNLGSRLNWSRPLFNGKVNINTGVSFDYRETPSIIRVDEGPEMRNTSKNPGMTFDFGLGSNISRNIDFNISSATSYNEVRNTLQTNLNQTYWIQRTGIQMNWMPKGSWVINSDFNHQLFTGFQQGFNQSIYLWNIGLGKKFGKDKGWDLRAQIYDLLNQNRSIVRNVNETYFEDVKTTVLTRYVMVQLTYNLRAFKGSRSEEDESMNQMHKMYYQRMYKR